MLKYYVEGSHEAIIDKGVFMRVQSEIARRANLNPDGKRRIYSSRYALSAWSTADTAVTSTEGSSGTTGAASLRYGDA